MKNNRHRYQKVTSISRHMKDTKIKSASKIQPLQVPKPSRKINLNGRMD